MVILVAFLLGRFAFVTFRNPEARRLYKAVWKATRWRTPLLALLDIVGKLGLFALFWQLPFLRWGWWLALGGSGNVLLGGTTPTDGPIGGGGGLSFLLVMSFLLPVVLFLVMPLLTVNEEAAFRMGTQKDPWWKVLRRNSWFGAVHLLMGVPLAVVPALTWSGVLYHLVYRKKWHRLVSEGMDEKDAEKSATIAAGSLHNLSNCILVVLVIASLVLAQTLA